MIYILNDDFPKTSLLNVDAADCFEKMPSYKPRFFAKPRLQEWVKPNAWFFYGDSPEPVRTDLPDVTVWSTGLIALSPIATEALRGHLSRIGEFLPISVYGEVYHLFNPLYVVPESAIDRSNAVELIDSGVHEGQGNVTYDEAYIDAQNAIIFKSPANKLISAMCTDLFKRLYDDNGFKGVTFEPLSRQ